MSKSGVIKLQTSAQLISDIIVLNIACLTASFCVAGTDLYMVRLAFSWVFSPHLFPVKGAISLYVAFYAYGHVIVD